MPGRRSARPPGWAAVSHLASETLNQRLGGAAGRLCRLSWRRAGNAGPPVWHDRCGLDHASRGHGACPGRSADRPGRDGGADTGADERRLHADMPAADGEQRPRRAAAAPLHPDAEDQRTDHHGNTRGKTIPRTGAPARCTDSITGNILTARMPSISICARSPLPIPHSNACS